MSDKIRLALVGCGGISKRHVEAYQTIQERGDKGFEVVAYCDPVEANAQKKASDIEAFQGKRPTVFSSVYDLIASKTIDAADICIPHAFHHSTAIPLLALKKLHWVELTTRRGTYKRRRLLFHQSAS